MRYFVGVVFVCFAICADSGCNRTEPTPDPPKFETPYQAILLDNGQVYYGKLAGLGTTFPTLRDVYYVQTSTNPETKQPSTMLLKRGKELHEPDHMVINAQHILLIEPVSAKSKVAALIAELEKR